jgi:hypothetical protein
MALDPSLRNSSITPLLKPIKPRIAMNLHLFFDVFIEDEPIDVYRRGDRRRFDLDYKIRTAAPAYKFQSKYNITRYALASYQLVPWKTTTFRIECQNEAHNAIYKEISETFPNANVQSSRSDTAEKYLKALSELRIKDDSWIFFSPNNDHPLISNHEKLESLIKDADSVVKNVDADVISIAYSHFTESMNFFSRFKHEYGAYGEIYPELLYETPHCFVVKLNKLLLDSIHIYRLSDLKWIFGSSTDKGRIIRPEDTEFYLTNKKTHVVIIPKFELCRHYDGYMHILDKIPPLFIPDGFFSSEIRIRYGYSKPKEGYVNINPLAEYFSYQSPNGFDAKTTLDDIPQFWRVKPENIDINPDFPKNLNKDALEYYADLINPWRSSYKISNLIRSYVRQLKVYIRSLKSPPP